ncbi:monocyte to macrophage differentiation factor 2 isoform X1 [Diabrotica undecimpunctata]|uniref:monocyte to macrophage differentiation factor 2 isoform X1 n=1 Tax=Diabrotica undecimpunctata TaxID=50387 RepID=UPI003B631C5E
MLSSTLLKQYLLYINRNTYLQKLKCIQWMNKKAPSKEAYCPTSVEHIANIITHGIWIIPSISAALELISRSKDADHMLSAIVYGATLIFVFSVSTSFHCVFFCKKYGQLKDVLHRCDRAMIYVFIAGSYFPWLTLEKLPHEGWSSQMRWIVWFLAIAGITYQQIFHEQYKMLETIFYLVMGVGPVFPIICEHTFKGITELSIGGLLYLIGIVFFKSDGRLPFAHAIWHLFVVSAAYAHYYAILNYLYPLPTTD